MARPGTGRGAIARPLNRHGAQWRGLGARPRVRARERARCGGWPTDNPDTSRAPAPRACPGGSGEAGSARSVGPWRGHAPSLSAPVSACQRVAALKTALAGGLGPTSLPHFPDGCAVHCRAIAATSTLRRISAATLQGGRRRTTGPAAALGVHVCLGGIIALR